MKKIYISADIEGVACIASGSEGDISKSSEYGPFRQQMTAEVVAACAGAYSAGVETIVIKDAHGSGRNIDPHQLQAPPGKSMQLIRGWSGHPFSMVQDIDKSFDALAFIGYHSAASSGGNPVSHTFSGMYHRVELNGVMCSEFMLYAYAAASVGVPLVFLSGDKALCHDAQKLISGLTTVPVTEGRGASVVSMLPSQATRLIEEGMTAALTAKAPSVLELPKEFHLKLTFQRPFEAYAKSFYPQARQISDTEVVLETKQYLDVLTFIQLAAK